MFRLPYISCYPVSLECRSLPNIGFPGYRELFYYTSRRPGVPECIISGTGTGIVCPAGQEQIAAPWVCEADAPAAADSYSSWVCGADALAAEDSYSSWVCGASGEEERRHGGGVRFVGHTKGGKRRREIALFHEFGRQRPGALRPLERHGLRARRGWRLVCLWGRRFLAAVLGRLPDIVPHE